MEVSVKGCDFMNAPISAIMCQILNTGESNDELGSIQVNVTRQGNDVKEITFETSTGIIKMSGEIKVVATQKL
jgi:hypothetical protein